VRARRRASEPQRDARERAAERTGESPGLRRPEMFPGGKWVPLGDSPPENGLPNVADGWPVEILRVGFLHGEKARNSVGFWAAKPALTVSILMSKNYHEFIPVYSLCFDPYFGIKICTLF